MAGRKRRTVETGLFAEDTIAAEPPAPSKESDVLRIDIPEDQVEEVRRQIVEALENSDEIPVIKVGEPAANPVEVHDLTGDGFTGDSVTDEDLYKELVDILSPQKGKRAVPTKIRFWSRYAQAWRHVIIDVNEYLLIDAYKCWLAHGRTDDEEFLDHVYKITKVDVPRMFRVVADLDLETMKARFNGPMRV